MILLNNYVRVKELQDDLIIDDVLHKYDSDSTYIFADIIEIDSIAAEDLILKYKVGIFDLKDNYVAVLRRITKIPLLDTYCVHMSDLIGFMKREEYEKNILK